MPRVQTVGVDFDGVIHSYDEGWKDGSIYGKLLPGAGLALETLMEQYAVFIFSTRDPIQIAKWMAEQGFAVRVEIFDDGTENTDLEFWNEQGIILITQRKLPAIAYIDDRAVRFESWPQTLLEMQDRYGTSIH